MDGRGANRERRQAKEKGGPKGTDFLARRPGIRARLLRVALPLSIVLVLAGIAMGYYFWRVTGNPFRMPYQVARATYATPPRYSSGRPPGPSPSITTR